MTGRVAAPTVRNTVSGSPCWDHVGGIGAWEALPQKERPRALPREAGAVRRQNTYTWECGLGEGQVPSLGLAETLPEGRVQVSFLPHP